MDATTADATSDIFINASELATWTRQRTSEELRTFVNAKHALLPDTIDIE